MNWRKKLTLSLYQQHKNTQSKLHELNYLFWECTLRCNFGCLHCGSDCTKEAEVPDMAMQDFLNVLDNIAPHVDTKKTMIVLTGGEPTVRKDLEICGREIFISGKLLICRKRLEGFLKFFPVFLENFHRICLLF